MPASRHTPERAGTSRQSRRRLQRRRVAAERRRRRRNLTAFALLLAVAGLVVLFALSGAGGPAPRPARLVMRSAQPAAVIGRETGRPQPPVKARSSSARTRGRTSQSSPGSLPQTHVFPSGASAQFRGLMEALWRGVVENSLPAALPAFFPRGAYVQLKAIGSAASDWRERLVHDYGLDLQAAHSLLGRHAAHARLLRVLVHASYGHWVPPGVCYNRVGYDELPNARVVYRSDGATRSFGIASMISWRGVWYVVHLGAILRSADLGVVDEPAGGAGSSVYSGTC